MGGNLHHVGLWVLPMIVGLCSLFAMDDRPLDIPEGEYVSLNMQRSTGEEHRSSDFGACWPLGDAPEAPLGIIADNDQGDGLNYTSKTLLGLVVTMGSGFITLASLCSCADEPYFDLYLSLGITLVALPLAYCLHNYRQREAYT